MERQKADGKHQHDDDNHPDGFSLFLHAGVSSGLAGPAKNLRHFTVEHQDDQERQNEAHAGQGDAVREIFRRALWDAQVVAHGAVALDARRGELERRSAEHHHGPPDTRANDPGEPAPSSFGPRSHRVTDAQVTLDTDAGEKEDAAVQVAVELKAHHAAGEVAKRPVVSAGIVVDEERERADVQKVRHRQVQHVNLSARERSPTAPDAQNDDEVERQAEDEDQTVDAWEEIALEVLVVGAGWQSGTGKVGRHLDSLPHILSREE